MENKQIWLNLNFVEQSQCLRLIGFHKNTIIHQVNFDVIWLKDVMKALKDIFSSTRTGKKTEFSNQDQHNFFQLHPTLFKRFEGNDSSQVITR